jgi:alkylation response protein AidB-like acyl-CoA dehydrogenase
VLAAIGGVRDWMSVRRIALDGAVEWARATLAPDGSRMIDDPLVRTRLARVHADVAISEATPPPFRRVVASDLLIRDAADLVDLCGADGIIAASDPASAGGGALEWVHRFAQGTSIYGGTTDIQRNLIAEHYVGLPRHRGLLRT